MTRSMENNGTWYTAARMATCLNPIERSMRWCISCRVSVVLVYCVHVVSVDDGSGRGSGSVLTCAHVVSADDDNGDGKGNRPPPNRLGRQKVIMFPSGRTFITEYKVVVEASDGIVDVAAMTLVIKIHADPPPHRRMTTKTQQGWCHNNDRTTTEGGSLRIERR